eukprot:g1215.t1
MALMLSMFQLVIWPVAAQDRPTIDQILEALDATTLSGFEHHWGKVDTDKDGVATLTEVKDRFRQNGDISEEDLLTYWHYCDDNPADHQLDFSEWLICAGEFDSTGQRYDESEWDHLHNDGSISYSPSPRPTHEEL